MKQIEQCETVLKRGGVDGGRKGGRKEGKNERKETMSLVDKNSWNPGKNSRAKRKEQAGVGIIHKFLF